MPAERRKIGIPESEPVLVRTRTGSFSVRMKCRDGSEKALHSLYDPEREATAAVSAFDFDGMGLLVVLGLGLGYHVAKLSEVYPQAELLVVEASPTIYEMARTYGRLPGHGVTFLVGLPQEEVIRQITRHQIKRGMAPIRVFALSASVSSLPEYYRPVLSRLKESSSVRLWERLKYPKFTQAVARVALIDSGYFLVREMENALDRLGHKTAKVPVGRQEDGNVSASRMIEKIIALRPDFFLTVNHLGFDQEGILTSFFRSIEMPVASWYVDSPNLIVKAFRENVSPFTAIFLWDRGYIRDMESMGFESVTYLPLATDERIFKPLRGRGKRGNALACEVGFVGNSMVRPTDERMAKVDPGLHPVVERLAEECLGQRACFDQLLSVLSDEDRTRVAALGSSERMNFEAAVLWKTTQRYRLQCIQKLCPFDLRIHGDTGWKTLVDKQGILHTPLDYYKELPLCYNACKINFNATSLQMGAAVNQRVFDVPACGAFLLTDHQEALDEAFHVGQEVVAFEHPEEIPDLVRFYLDHPAERQAIAGRGRARVLKEHTYQHRLNCILERMRARYGQKG